MSERVDEAIYKDFLDDKRIVLNEEIDASSVPRVVMMIKKWNVQDDRQEEESMCPHCKKPLWDRSSDPIHIYINSPGGCYTSSMAIVGAIMASKTPVHTHVVGLAASGAGLVAIAGWKRYAQKYSRIMIHQGSIRIRADMTNANVMFDESNRETLEMFNFISSRTKIKLKDLKEKTEGKDWYFTPEEAKVFGIIDEVE